MRSHSRRAVEAGVLEVGNGARRRAGAEALFDVLDERVETEFQVRYQGEAGWAELVVAAGLLHPFQGSAWAAEHWLAITAKACWRSTQAPMPTQSGGACVVSSVTNPFGT